MKFEQALEKAKQIARKDFIDEMRQGFKGSMASEGGRKKYDPAYDNARIWKPVKFKNCSGYALSGTPPKAYLMILPEQKKILCKRLLSQEAFEVIDFEDEPTGSS